MLSRIDHVVLTVADIEKTVAFYSEALGMARVDFGEGRVALAFGEQKINLHLAGHELEPKALAPTPGSGDLCLIANRPLDEVRARLDQAGVSIEEGPVARTGATGPITSLYFRDPDQNLIEVSTYDVGRPKAPSPYDLLAPVPAMSLRSDDFAEGETLGDAHVFSGDNLSPHLAWDGAPEGTKSLVISCYDPDAPTGVGFFHWYVVGLDPTTTELARGAAVEGVALRNDFGNHQYDGSAPPPGDGPHRYIFAVHALDATPEEMGQSADTPLGQAGFGVTAHTLARGTLTGLYETPAQ